MLTHQIINRDISSLIKALVQDQDPKETLINGETLQLRMCRVNTF